MQKHYKREHAGKTWFTTCRRVSREEVDDKLSRELKQKAVIKDRKRPKHDLSQEPSPSSRNDRLRALYSGQRTLSLSSDQLTYKGRKTTCDVATQTLIQNSSFIETDISKGLVSNGVADCIVVMLKL